MMEFNPVAYPDLTKLVSDRKLKFPMATKDDFVEQMVESGADVQFRGMSYDARFGASLIPEFFFPVQSDAELIGKVVELLISRGLLPLPSAT